MKQAAGQYRWSLSTFSSFRACLIVQPDLSMILKLSHAAAVVLHRSRGQLAVFGDKLGGP